MFFFFLSSFFFSYLIPKLEPPLGLGVSVRVAGLGLRQRGAELGQLVPGGAHVVGGGLRARTRLARLALRRAQRARRTAVLLEELHGGM